ncbi:hypothetical protein TWF696_001665 [Orbilia brochopaga]|uniref:Uncharacterized protein n=1 Tax=Orbilia brochopaga TaxID=3140254 RepID=A0AAV9U5E1_9PEZI
MSNSTREEVRYLTIKAEKIPTKIKRGENGHRPDKCVRIPASVLRAESVTILAPSSSSDSTSSGSSCSDPDRFDPLWYIRNSTNYLRDHLTSRAYCRQGVLSTDPENLELFLSESELNEIATKEHMSPWKVDSIKTGGGMIRYGADEHEALSELRKSSEFWHNSEAATGNAEHSYGIMKGWKMASALSGRLALLDMGAGLPPECAVWEDKHRGRKLNPTNWVSLSPPGVGLYAYKQPHHRDPRLIGVASIYNLKDAVYCADKLVFVWKPDIMRPILEEMVPPKQQTPANYKDERVHPRTYYQRIRNEPYDGHTIKVNVNEHGGSSQRHPFNKQLSSASGPYPFDICGHGHHYAESDRNYCPTPKSSGQIGNWNAHSCHTVGSHQQLPYTRVQNNTSSNINIKAKAVFRDADIEKDGFYEPVRVQGSQYQEAHSSPSVDTSHISTTDNHTKLSRDLVYNNLGGPDEVDSIFSGSRNQLPCDGATDPSKWPSWINDDSDVCEDDIENAPIFERSNGEGIRVVYIRKDPKTGKRTPIVDFVCEHDERYELVRDLIDQGRGTNSTVDNLTVDCPQVSEQELRVRLAIAYNNLDAKMDSLKAEGKFLQRKPAKRGTKWNKDNKGNLLTVVLGAQGPIPLDGPNDDVLFDTESKTPYLTDFPNVFHPHATLAHNLVTSNCHPYTPLNNPDQAAQTPLDDSDSANKPLVSELEILSVGGRSVQIWIENNLVFFQIDDIRSFYPQCTTPSSETEGPPISPLLQPGISAPPLFKSVANHPKVARSLAAALARVHNTLNRQHQRSGFHQKPDRQPRVQINPYIALFAGQIPGMPPTPQQQYDPLANFQKNTLLHGASYFPEVMKYISAAESHSNRRPQVLPIRIDMYPGYMYDFKDWMTYGRHGIPGQYEDSDFTKPETWEDVLRRLQDQISWEQNRIGNLRLEIKALVLRSLE